jgi:hypothetical protein
LRLRAARQSQSEGEVPARVGHASAGQPAPAVSGGEAQPIRLPLVTRTDLAPQRHVRPAPADLRERESKRGHAALGPVVEREQPALPPTDVTLVANEEWISIFTRGAS